MFYSDSHDSCLRFGDVIKGVPYLHPDIEGKKDFESIWPFRISAPASSFLVVLSPCCSIEDKVVVVAPLKAIPASFFKNPFFAADFTRINCAVSAQNAVPPTAWTNMTPTERAEREARGNAFVFTEKFVYAPHVRLPPYNVPIKGSGNTQVSHYVVDFRDSVRLSGEVFIRGSEVASAGLKVIQISIETRQLLREKIAYYFSRVPAEDTVSRGT